MKANQTVRKLRDDRAEVGVGTLIVFIAMVLVAAVAAAVLINTTGTLQQRAQSTGKEATQEVASNLKVTGVYGSRAGTSGSLSDLNLTAELSAGAVPMDLTKLIIRYSDGTNTYTFTDAATSSAHEFNTTWVRGAGTGSVMQSGDLVQIWMNGITLAARTNVQVALIPETGTPVNADFKTPPTYGTDTTVTLR